MNTPLERTRRGAIVCGIVFIGAIVGYKMLLTNESWLDVIYFVVITVSSVGYSEPSDFDPALQLFTIGVIVLGMTAAGYTIGGLLQMMTEGEIQRAMGHRRITRGISNLQDHVVVCGYGRTGQILAGDLDRQRLPFVVIDHDAERIGEAIERGYLAVTGDATEEEVLSDAGVERAKTLVTGLPNDAFNVFITLTARNMNASIQIIARAEDPATQKKLKQAGADRVVMPTSIGAQRMAWLVTRPTSADLMELFTDREILDIDMDEVEIPATSNLVGITVVDAMAHRQHRLLFAAIKQADGEMVFNPDADYEFRAGDIIIIMGRMEDIERFRQEYGL